MIAIAKTDSFYFSSMILNAMQLMGSCDFEKLYPRSQRHCTYRGVVITIAARFSKVKSVIYMSGLRSRFGNRDRRGHCTYCEAVMAIAVRFS